MLPLTPACPSNVPCFQQQTPRSSIDNPPFVVSTFTRPAEALLGVLHGEAVAGVTAGAVASEACEQIYTRFKKAPEREVSSDGVSRSILGATHYKKTPFDYVRDVLKTSQAVNRVLGGKSDVILQFISDLAVEAQFHGIQQVRPLNHRGLPAGHARLFMCDTLAGNEKLVLQHHEDYSQVSASINLGSEFHLIKPSALVAANFYFRVEPGLGALEVFDFRPTRGERSRLGVGEYGFPYPENCVADRDRLSICVETGDMVALRGAYVHAVVSGAEATKDRLIANLFLARIGSTIVYWT